MLEIKKIDLNRAVHSLIIRIRTHHYWYLRDIAYFKFIFDRQHYLCSCCKILEEEIQLLSMHVILEAVILLCDESYFIHGRVGTEEELEFHMRTLVSGIELLRLRQPASLSNTTKSHLYRNLAKFAFLQSGKDNTPTPDRNYTIDFFLLYAHDMMVSLDTQIASQWSYFRSLVHCCTSHCAEGDFVKAIKEFGETADRFREFKLWQHQMSVLGNICLSFALARDDPKLRERVLAQEYEFCSRLSVLAAEALAEYNPHNLDTITCAAIHGVVRSVQHPLSPEAAPVSRRAAFTFGFLDLCLFVLSGTSCTKSVLKFIDLAVLATKVASDAFLRQKCFEIIIEAESLECINGTKPGSYMLSEWMQHEGLPSWMRKKLDVQWAAAADKSKKGDIFSRRVKTALGLLTPSSVHPLTSFAKKSDDEILAAVRECEAWIADANDESDDRLETFAQHKNSLITLLSDSLKTIVSETSLPNRSSFASSRNSGNYRTSNAEVLSMVLDLKDGMGRSAYMGFEVSPTDDRSRFGVLLENLALQDGTSEPLVVTVCCNSLEEYFSSSVEDVSSLYTSKAYLPELIARYRESFRRDSLSTRDLALAPGTANSFQAAVSVAALLKQFFLELPGSFFPHTIYPMMVKATRKRFGSMSALITALKSDDMSPARLLTLNRLLTHFSRLGAAINSRFHLQLVEVWSPILFRGFEIEDGLEVHRAVTSKLLYIDPDKLVR